MSRRHTIWTMAVALLVAACTAGAEDVTTTAATEQAPSELIDPGEPALESVPSRCGSAEPACGSVRVWLDGSFEIGLVGVDAPDGEPVASGDLDVDHRSQLRHLVDDFDLASVATAEADRHCPEVGDAGTVVYTIATPAGPVTLTTCPTGDAEEPYVTAGNIVRSALLAHAGTVAVRTAELEATTLPYEVIRDGGSVVEGRVESVADDGIVIEVRAVRHGSPVDRRNDRLAVSFDPDDMDATDTDDDAFDGIAAGDRVIAVVGADADVVSVGELEHGDLVDLASSDVTFGLGHIMHLSLATIPGPLETGSECTAAGFDGGLGDPATALDQLDGLAEAATRAGVRDAARRLARRRGDARTTTIDYVGKPGGVYLLLVDDRGLLGFAPAGAPKSGSVEVAIPPHRSRVGVWLVERAAVAPCRPYEIAAAVANLGFEFVRIPRDEVRPGRNIRVNLNKGTWRNVS